jgi:hypothetical protein
MVLQAEPGSCNADGNAKQMVTWLTSPLFALRVRDATHCVLEQPTDCLAELVCGKADPGRHAIFERQALAVLKTLFFRAAPSWATLDAATKDVGIKDLSTRALRDFSY